VLDIPWIVPLTILAIEECEWGEMESWWNIARLPSGILKGGQEY
jgi:hypothetical protein